MKQKRIMEQAIKDAEKDKKFWEDEYDKLLTLFIKENRKAENHNSYLKILETTYAHIASLNGKIDLLNTLKEKM